MVIFPINELNIVPESVRRVRKKKVKNGKKNMRKIKRTFVHLRS